MKNSQGITFIRFTRTIYPFCPLGNENYKAEIVVQFTPKDTLFDFCSVDKEIKELTKQNLIIEDVVEKVYNIMLCYNPQKLSVTVNGESNTHFPVSVTKE